MRDNKYIKVKANLFWLLLLTFFLLSTNCFAQSSRDFLEYNGLMVYSATETYDNAILLVSKSIRSSDKPTYIIKYTLEGKELWRKKLNNLLDLATLIVTIDSGFAISATVNMYPNLPKDPEHDTTAKIAILKFDKCGNLLWAKYININNYSLGLNISEDYEGNLFLGGYGINGEQAKRKNITILKFDVNGNLKINQSYEGVFADIYPDADKKNMYIQQVVYVPKNKEDTNVVYLFTGITKVNNNLQTIAKIVIGFKEWQFNSIGPLLIKDNNVISISKAYKNNTDKSSSAMFTVFDTSLVRKTSDFIFDTEVNNKLSPAYANYIGSNIVTSNGINILNGNINDAGTSIRLYDSTLKFKKEVKYTTNWNKLAQPLLVLNNHNIITGVYNIFNDENADFSTLTYFDSNLNQHNWPTESPSKGYDWACITQIAKEEIIDVEKIVEPVKVAIDTTRENWDWLFALSVREPEREMVGTINNGWVIWPQPALINQTIRFISRNGLKNAQSSNLAVYLYDLQGKLIYKTKAVKENENQFNIKLNNLKPGLYMSHIIDINSNSIIGRCKLIIQ